MMMKNVMIAVLAILLVAVSIYSFQTKQDLEKAKNISTQLAIQAEESTKRAERIIQKAEQQAALATKAMAETAVLAEELEKCKGGK